MNVYKRFTPRYDLFATCFGLKHVVCSSKKQVSQGFSCWFCDGVGSVQENMWVPGPQNLVFASKITGGGDLKSIKILV